MAAFTNSPDNLFFTGPVDSPRDLDVIGDFNNKPIFFRFETIEPQASSTMTMISRNAEGLVGSLEWLPGDRLGRLKVGQHTLSMATFVGQGSGPYSRSFRSGDNDVFEWKRRNQTDYSLHDHRGHRIASFERFSPPKLTPIGALAHGVFQCTIKSDVLLFQALVALCINRWLDTFGLS